MNEIAVSETYKGFQKIGRWIAVWCHVDDEDNVIARYKDARKAAEDSLRNNCCAVELRAYKIEWGVPDTVD